MKKTTLILLAVLVTAAGATQGATIFSRNGTPIIDNTVGGVFDYVLATSWTQPFNTVNTSIDVYNFFPYVAGSTPAVTFDLRQNAPDGPNTASTTITLGAAFDFNVFQNLALGASTYYLVAYVNPAGAGQADAIWQTIDSFVNPVISMAPGVTAGTEYQSFSGSGGFQPQTMDLGFAVNGSVVPEPASMLLIGLGLAGLGLLRRRRA